MNRVDNIYVISTANSCVRGTDLTVKGKNEQKLKAASIPSVTMETPQLLLLVLLGLLIYTNCLKLRKYRHPILGHSKFYYWATQYISLWRQNDTKRKKAVSTTYKRPSNGATFNFGINRAPVYKNVTSLRTFVLLLGKL